MYKYYSNQSQEKKKVINNTFFLLINTVTNYILPFLTFPYIVRIVGPEKFGLIVFAQALVAYFVWLIDYGFVHSAPKKLAIHKDDTVSVQKIFSSIFFIKVWIFIVSLVAYLAIVFSFQKFSGDWPIYLFTFPVALNNVIFPIWFFQGMEDMKYISLVNFIMKLIFTISIFFFVKVQHDYIYIPLINSLGIILTGLLSLIIIRFKFKIKLIPPSFSDMLVELKDGWYIFLSMGSVGIYYASTTFILGLFSNNTVVGIYKSAETIIRALTSGFAPISQAVYPFICRLGNHSIEAAYGAIKKLLLFIGASSFLLSLFVFVFADKIANVLLGSQFSSSIIILKILSPIIFATAVSSILGVQGMLAFNKNKAFFKVVLSACIFCILSSLILVPFFKEIGTAIALLVTELGIAVVIALYLKVRKIIF